MEDFPYWSLILSQWHLGARKVVATFQYVCEDDCDDGRLGIVRSTGTHTVTKDIPARTIEVFTSE